MRHRRTGLAVVLVVVFASWAAADDGDRSRLTVERIVANDEFRTEGFGPARWMDKGEAYTTVEPAASGKGREIVRYETETGRREVLVSAGAITPKGAEKPLGIDNYLWSEDGRKLLVFTNTKRVWRQNTRGDYWLLDLANKTLTKLGGDGPESTLMFAKFAPDGGRVAYVRANDLYVEELSDGKITRLTDDGSARRSNGTADWVYEEEFNLRDGFRWSPDGRSIVYWQIDDDGVQDYLLVNTTESLYPHATAIPYPKVGQTNPACRVGIVPASGGETRWVDLPGNSRDFYIPRMDWAGNSESLILQRLNRLQNTNEVTLVDASTAKPRVLFTDRDDAWLDVVDDLHTIDDGRQFTWISERDGWRHAYLLPRDGGEPKVIAPGPYDVLDVLRVDAERNAIDFLASPDNPTQRYLFRASLDGDGPPTRITPADQAGTHGYQISPDGKWAIHTFSTFDMPPRIDLVSLPDHRVVRTFTDNAKLVAKLSALKATPTEFLRVDIGDGVALDAWAIRPPDFDPSRTYPLIVHVYGEPAGQTVLDQWGGRNGLWHRMMAQRGYVVVSFDNRGTPSPEAGPGARAFIDRSASLPRKTRPPRCGPWNGNGHSSTPIASGSGAGAAAGR